MTDLVSILPPVFPLRITEVGYTEDQLLLKGESWSLSVVCPWRIRRGDDLWTAWSDSSAADLVAGLTGTDILDVRMIDGGPDPAFQLSGGLELQVFGDTDYDPWVMAIPDLVVVGLVSPPGIQ